VGFETAAIPDATMNPGLADAAHVSGAAGGRLKLSQHLFLAATFTWLQFFNRDNTGKSRLADFQLPTKLPDAGGKYTQRIAILNTNLEVLF
jgi:long-chain fatty acid transport protein